MQLAQGTCIGIRTVTELLHRCKNTLFCRSRDTGRAIQHVGNGRRRHLRVLSYIIDSASPSNTAKFGSLRLHTDPLPHIMNTNVIISSSLGKVKFIHQTCLISGSKKNCLPS